MLWRETVGDFRFARGVRSAPPSGRRICADAPATFQLAGTRTPFCGLGPSDTPVHPWFGPTIITSMTGRLLGRNRRLNPLRATRATTPPRKKKKKGLNQSSYGGLLRCEQTAADTCCWRPSR